MSNNNNITSSLRRYQELDDESILSGIYTESGEYASGMHPITHSTLDPENEDDDEDEAFRRKVQAEQTRVMREFGLTPPSHQDVISLAHEEEEESIADTSLYTDAYVGVPLQQPEEEETIVFTPTDKINDKKSTTPETQDDDSLEEDASTVPPNTLFPPPPLGGGKSGDDDDIPILMTPRRLKMIMALLCTIVVVSIAVAMGSFLAQDQGNKKDVVPNDLQVPGNVVVTAFPTVSPSESYDWTTTPECKDHPSQRFTINEQWGEQDCAFLQSHAAQRERLCQPDQPGYRWCPATCDLCPLTEDESTPIPSRAPIILTSVAPSAAATIAGTPRPTTRTPTLFPTSNPTAQPVPKPTHKPTRTPTAAPTESTPEPTAEPTRQPVLRRTPDPTPEPTLEPTAEPTPYPTVYYDYYTPEPTFLETMVDTTAEPTPSPSSSSFLCRTCPLYICELIPC